MENHDVGNLYASTTDSDMVEVCVPEGSTNLSVTTVLNYCKKKILNPYLKFLSFTGLRPIISEQVEPSICLNLISHIYTVHVIALLVIGYILQYMACFRRDRGFFRIERNDTNLGAAANFNYIYDKTCSNGSLLYSFLIPSVLHFVGYLYAVIIFRNSDDDQLPILMERVFLSSANLPNGLGRQKKLVTTLWWFIIGSILWMLASLTSVNVMMAEGDFTFKWIQTSPVYYENILKILLVICTLWQDIIQATVISNYCLQAQLLTSYLQFLRQKLLQYPIQPLEWMRDIEEFKKMLYYFNVEIAPSVCLFTIVNLSCAISGLLWFFNFDKRDIETLPIFGLSILNVTLWILIAIAPFIQAARLTSACEMIKTVGQEVRIRPYVHQDTPGYELDSILMYTTSLNIDARLYHIPISVKYLCFFITSASIFILVLGQCHYIL